MEINKMNWEQVEWISRREKMFEKTFQSIDITVSYSKVIPGHEPGPHSHVFEQIPFMLQGEADYYVDGKVYPMVPGDIMSIPPHVEHHIVAKGTEPVIILEIFHPRRTEREQSKVIES